MSQTAFFGRHRAKIGALQTPTPETLEYARSAKERELGPGNLAISEWRERGLSLPNLDAMRQYRLNRVREQLRARDYAGIILYDPLNIRYATDSTNMQVWTLHNAVRYCYIATDGPVVLFDFHGCNHLNEHLDLIDEIRSAAAWYYFGAGPNVAHIAKKWAAELVDLVQQHGGTNQRVAIDKCSPDGARALEQLGLELFNGEEVMELARVIKSDEEIAAMRCAIATCEVAMRVMQDKLEPGITEQRLWSYLHAENIARGGEWIETRLLTSGPRTNPWMQECSSRVIEEGDIVAFDTDLIGPYGYCSDISRTWLCGGVKPTDEQRALYRMAREQILFNQSLLKAGVSFGELVERGFTLPENCKPNRYSIMYHGIGLCDEYPAIYYPEDHAKGGYDGVLEENMVVCVESYIGQVGGREGVKLEEQVLITREGCVALSSYPYEDVFLR
jgi:Xaa-Pro aminopeptidase